MRAEVTRARKGAANEVAEDRVRGDEEDAEDEQERHGECNAAPHGGRVAAAFRVGDLLPVDVPAQRGHGPCGKRADPEQPAVEEIVQLGAHHRAAWHEREREADDDRDHVQLREDGRVAPAQAEHEERRHGESYGQRAAQPPGAPGEQRNEGQRDERPERRAETEGRRAQQPVGEQAEEEGEREDEQPSPGRNAHEFDQTRAVRGKC